MRSSRSSPSRATRWCGSTPSSSNSTTSSSSSTRPRSRRSPIPLPTSNWADYLTERADGALADARRLLDELKGGTPRGADEVVRIWNDADIALGNAKGLAGVLAQMHPDEDVRTLAEEREQAVA